MSQTHETLRNGQQEAVGGGKALAVAQGGLRSMRDLANFSIAHSIDTLRGQVGVREANTSLRAIGETRKLIVDGQRVGYNKEVLDLCGEDEEAALVRREQELTAELEAVRERRGGKQKAGRRSPSTN